MSGRSSARLIDARPPSESARPRVPPIAVANLPFRASVRAAGPAGTASALAQSPRPRRRRRHRGRSSSRTGPATRRPGPAAPCRPDGERGCCDDGAFHHPSVGAGHRDHGHIGRVSRKRCRDDVPVGAEQDDAAKPRRVPRPRARRSWRPWRAPRRSRRASNADSEAIAACGFVAFESSTYATPSTSATRSIRCGSRVERLQSRDGPRPERRRARARAPRRASASATLCGAPVGTSLTLGQLRGVAVASFDERAVGENAVDHSDHADGRDAKREADSPASFDDVGFLDHLPGRGSSTL